MTRPERSEYADYYHLYVARVPDGDILEMLARQREVLVGRLRRIPEERGDHRYAEGKWSVKEVLGHVVDCEWMFTYRALHFARGQKIALPGIDQHDFLADEYSQPMEDLIRQLVHVRAGNVMLFSSFDEKTWDRTGIASECSFTVRSIPYIIAGHAKHHMRVLRERYL